MDKAGNRDMIGNNLAFVYIKGEMNKQFEPISRDLFNSGAITSLTRTNSPITDVWSGDDTYTWEGKRSEHAL